MRPRRCRARSACSDLRTCSRGREKPRDGENRSSGGAENRACTPGRLNSIYALPPPNGCTEQPYVIRRTLVIVASLWDGEPAVGLALRTWSSCRRADR